MGARRRVSSGFVGLQGGLEVDWKAALDRLGRGETVYRDVWPISYLDAQFAPAGSLDVETYPHTAFNGAPFRVLLCGFGACLGAFTPTEADELASDWRR